MTLDYTKLKLQGQGPLLKGSNPLAQSSNMKKTLNISKKVRIHPQKV
jgi:hypothetical protein